MFENVDGRTTDGRTDDGRTTDDGVTGILIAHLRAFGSGELKSFITSRPGILPDVYLIFGHKTCKIETKHGKILDQIFTKLNKFILS